MESYFSAREIEDMHFMYGRANGNAREARRLYAEHYPQCRIPSHKLFTKFHQRLIEFWSVAPSLNAYCSAFLVSSETHKIAHTSAGVDFWTYVD
jgi:hypothetical protein